MDPVTHGAAGAFVAWAWPRRWQVTEGVPIAVAGALLPDIDLFIDPFVRSGTAFEHRAFTHSLLGIAVLAPVLALAHLWRNQEKKYAHYVALAAMGMFSHVVLDLPTEIGEKVLYPFYRRTVYLDWLGHIDFTLFIIILFILLAAWTYTRRAAALRRGILSATLLALVTWWLFAEWPLFAFHRNQRFTIIRLSEASFHTVYPLVLGGTMLALLLMLARKGWGFRHDRVVFGRAGVAALCIYLLICGAAKWEVLREMRQFTDERGIVVLARAAARPEAFSFVAPLRWSGLILAPEGVYGGEISPFSREKPAFTFYRNAPENSFVARSRTNPRVRHYLSEARFPVSCYAEDGAQHIVEFYDHGSGGGIARVALNERLDTLTVNWIPIDEYVASASLARTGLPHGGASVASLSPCFLR